MARAVLFDDIAGDEIAVSIEELLRCSWILVVARNDEGRLDAELPARIRLVGRAVSQLRSIDELPLNPDVGNDAILERERAGFGRPKSVDDQDSETALE